MREKFSLPDRKKICPKVNSPFVRFFDATLLLQKKLPQGRFTVYSLLGVPLPVQEKITLTSIRSLFAFA
jgi:hypothetical protein